jgi:hypothetical protein
VVDVLRTADADYRSVLLVDLRLLAGLSPSTPSADVSS